MSKKLNRYFIKVEIQIVNKHMKIFLTFFLIKEMWIKSHWEIIIPSSDEENSKSWQYQILRKIWSNRNSYLSGGNVNLYNLFGKQWILSNKGENTHTLWSFNFTVRYIHSTEICTYGHQDTAPKSSWTFPIKVKNGKQPKCPYIFEYIRYLLYS